MALDGTRLEGTSQAAALAEIQALFPIPSGLLPAEQAAMAAAQTDIAEAIGNGVGSPVVTEIETNALVNVVGVTPGGGTATGTVV